jgi:hypothetical protein
MEKKKNRRLQKLALSAIFLVGVFSIMECAALGQQERKAASGAQWTESFDLERCSFSSTGKNKYFVLEPGYQLTLEGFDGEDTVELVITVLNETDKIGDIETRVVEERESANGKLVEVSRNYYAICTQTNSVFYFGEDVDIFREVKVVSHSGAWRVGSGGAQAGLMMPGVVLLGARYYQEMAPGVAMDRAEIVDNNETLQTPLRKFEECLKTEETTPLEPHAREYKLYAPEIGLIKDGNLLLTGYGFTLK